MPPGLASKQDHNSDWHEQTKEWQQAYLIWPKNATLPPGLTSKYLRLIGSFSAKSTKGLPISIGSDGLRVIYGFVPDCRSTISSQMMIEAWRGRMIAIFWGEALG